MRQVGAVNQAKLSAPYRLLLGDLAHRTPARRKVTSSPLNSLFQPRGVRGVIRTHTRLGPNHFIVTPRVSRFIARARIYCCARVASNSHGIANPVIRRSRSFLARSARRIKSKTRRSRHSTTKA